MTGNIFASKPITSYNIVKDVQEEITVKIYCFIVKKEAFNTTDCPTVGDAFFYKYYFIILFSAILILLITLPVKAFQLSPQALQQIQQKYGNAAVKRTIEWQNLINDNQHGGELHKLRVVTDFFNQFKSSTDGKIWGKENYWATPVEFLGQGQGDCEDFALAKYFTLKEMGIPIDRLRLVYVTSKKLKQAHMVLAYYEMPDADPLILDNLTPWILYGSERPDLIPIYTFNSESIWLITKNNTQKSVSSIQEYSLWNDLIQKMQREAMPKEMLQ